MPDCLALQSSTDILAGDISEVKLLIVQDAYCHEQKSETTFVAFGI